jgi:hypothetical protein
MPGNIKFTRRLQNNFLMRLKKTGNVRSSADKVGMSRSWVYKFKEQDEAFAEKWTDALEDYVATLEAEADRRAVKGNKKKVFYGGKEIGTTQDFSDTLLMFRLKALKPERYRDRSDSKISGDVTVIRKVYAEGDVDGAPDAGGAMITDGTSDGNVDE